MIQSIQAQRHPEPGKKAGRGGERHPEPEDKVDHGNDFGSWLEREKQLNRPPGRYPQPDFSDWLERERQLNERNPQDGPDCKYPPPPGSDGPDCKYPPPPTDPGTGGWLENERQLQVSDQAREAINFLARADKATVIHTTRAPQPQFENAFPAGRFGVSVTKGSETRYFIMQTESKVGHLQPVTPGVTEVNGWIAAVPDQNALYEEPETRFTKAEERELLMALLQRGNTKALKDVPMYVAAIYSDGNPNRLIDAYNEAGRTPPAYLA